MDSDPLLVEKHGHVAIVTLNRPKERNALSIDLMTKIERLAEKFNKDIETRVVIFTGAGNNFSAGVDLKDPVQAEALAGPLLARQRQYHMGPRLIRKLAEMNQITIAAIDGVALGGAACIATALDFRIGTNECRIGYPEVNLGIPLSWISLPLCVHLIGPANAKRMVILGKQEDPQTLLKWGFLDAVVPGDQLMKRAMDMAKVYAAQAPVAAQMIKRSINAIMSSHDQALMHMDSDQVLLTQLSGDFKEGVEAFFQKRNPDFKGN